MKKFIVSLGLIALLPLVPLPGAGEARADEVNLYSYRQPFLIKPMLDEFTKRTGIQVNTVFAKKGVLEKIKATLGAADAVLTSDVGRLNDMSAAGVLFPVKSEILAKNIPAQYRHPDGLWFGLTMRARILFVSKNRIKQGEAVSF